MKKTMILTANPKYEYTLIVRLDRKGNPLECQPYVVAWKYNEIDNTWEQGNYFQTIEYALIFMHFRHDAEEIYSILKETLNTKI